MDYHQLPKTFDFQTISNHWSKIMGSDNLENLSLNYQSIMYEGVVYPPFIKPEALAQLRKQHTLRSNDIVIAAYPKCGTTWMQQIVLTLLADGDGSKVRRPMDMSPWLEAWVSSQGLAAFEEWHPEKTGWNGLENSCDLNPSWCPSRRVLKTHAPSQLAPWVGGTEHNGMNGARIIVVTRNPKDVAVSHYYHTIDLPHIFQYNGSWDHFLTNLWIPGKVESGSFWEWHQSWWNIYQSASVNLLWVSYEDLLQKPKELFRKIAEFIQFKPTLKAMEGVLEASKFESMKQTAAEEDAKMVAIGKADQVKTNHIRHGKSGGWLKVFTKDQNELMNRYHMSECARLSLPPKLFPQMRL